MSEAPKSSVEKKKLFSPQNRERLSDALTGRRLAVVAAILAVLGLKTVDPKTRHNAWRDARNVAGDFWYTFTTGRQVKAPTPFEVPKLACDTSSTDNPLSAHLIPGTFTASPHSPNISVRPDGREVHFGVTLGLLPQQDTFGRDAYPTGGLSTNSFYCEENLGSGALPAIYAHTVMDKVQNGRPGTALLSKRGSAQRVENAVSFQPDDPQALLKKPHFKWMQLPEDLRGHEDLKANWIALVDGGDQEVHLIQLIGDQQLGSNIVDFYRATAERFPAPQYARNWRVRAHAGDELGDGNFAFVAEMPLQKFLTEVTPHSSSQE